MADEIISRAEAQARGLKNFFTGRACIHGHICKRNVKNRSCHECITIAVKKSVLLHREKRLAEARRYKDKNKDRLTALRKEKYLKDRDKILQKTRDWINANPEKARATRKRIRETKKHQYQSYIRSRRARLRGALGSHTVEDLEEILRLQKNRCAHCRSIFGKSLKPTLDHIIALFRGGSNYRQNLQFLCGPCNSSKCASDPIDYARRKGLLL